MNFKGSMCILAVALIALKMPVQLAAQGDQKPKGEHHRYKVVDLGTLGGPASFIPNLWSQDVNRPGTVIAEADTPTLDPNCGHETRDSKRIGTTTPDNLVPNPHWIRRGGIPRR